jgi:SNF2 family DNA or RNA helicase
MDTIDERVREIVETKKELADYLVDGKENNVSISLQNEMRNILRSL